MKTNKELDTELIVDSLEDIQETSFDLSATKEFDKVLSKKFGRQYKGFGDASKFESVKRVPLDCISLNNILGGGLPVGRMIEIFGEKLI